MAAERFFQRWSRLKAAPEAPLADAAPRDIAFPAPPPVSAPAPADGDAEAPPVPTLDDVAQLHAGSDYSAFVARGVDTSVRRGALKKLFADPHFNVGDGLDLYMGDYNKPDPIPAAMMSALRHTQSFFAQAYPDKQEEGGADGAPVPDIGDAGQALALAHVETPVAGASTAAPATDATSEDHP